MIVLGNTSISLMKTSKIVLPAIVLFCMLFAFMEFTKWASWYFGFTVTSRYYPVSYLDTELHQIKEGDLSTTEIMESLSKVAQ